MNAHERLNQAVRAANEGRYDEALQEYIWFHNHALEDEPSLSGVRLSFALGYWLELGEKYPPALVALRSIRDEKTNSLVSASEDLELFIDVSSINEALSEEKYTYDLFLAVNQLSPEFANLCSRIALPAIVNCRDYALARSFLPKPSMAVARLASQMNEDIEWSLKAVTIEHSAVTIRAIVHNYAEDIQMLTDIIRETDGHNAAEELKGYAIESVTNDDARKAIDAMLGVPH
jgi:hypothetical protein